jgi:hypothetical protein
MLDKPYLTPRNGRNEAATRPQPTRLPRAIQSTYLQMEADAMRGAWASVCACIMRAGHRPAMKRPNPVLCK